MNRARELGWRALSGALDLATEIATIGPARIWRRLDYLALMAAKRANQRKLQQARGREQGANITRYRT